MRARKDSAIPPSAERRGATPSSSRPPAPQRTLCLPHELRGRLAAWICAGYPYETCGLLIGRAGKEATEVEDLVQARNLNRERPGDRFELDPDAFAATDRRVREVGLEIVGIWHSHPDHPAIPSQTDRTGAWAGWSYLIASVGRQGLFSLRSWSLQEETFVEEVIEP